MRALVAFSGMSKRNVCFSTESPSRGMPMTVKLEFSSARDLLRTVSSGPCVISRSPASFAKRT